MSNNVFLIGYMGSGKTTYGKILAKKLGLEFMDLDLLIETGEHKSIKDIFSDVGESEFREIERNYLRKIVKSNKTIIALGGGTPCYLDNMKLINDSGITVYLKVPVFKLQQSLVEDVNNRPILMGMNPHEMLEFIQQHIGEREKYYLKSDLIFSGDNSLDLLLLIEKSFSE